MNGVIRNSCLGIGLAAVLLSAGCGYHFAGGPGTNPYPPEVKTVVIKSAAEQHTDRGDRGRIHQRPATRVRNGFEAQTGQERRRRYPEDRGD